MTLGLACIAHPEQLNHGVSEGKTAAGRTLAGMLIWRSLMQPELNKFFSLRSARIGTDEQMVQLYLHRGSVIHSDGRYPLEQPWSATLTKSNTEKYASFERKIAVGHSSRPPRSCGTCSSSSRHDFFDHLALGVSVVLSVFPLLFCQSPFSPGVKLAIILARPQPVAESHHPLYFGASGRKNV